MQAFFVAAKGGASEVELDRCAQCGALWFNAGEVEQALGRTVRRRQGASSRSCPTCRVKLEAAVLEGRIEVERCGTCQGVFLDGHDVEALSFARTAYRTDGGSGFECEACHQRRPFSDATSTVTGLVCAACAAKTSAPQPVGPEGGRSALGRLLGWFRGE
jgi:Zn-finger nucleic acid-binding protein